MAEIAKDYIDIFEKRHAKLNLMFKKNIEFGLKEGLSLGGPIRPDMFAEHLIRITDAILYDFDIELKEMVDKECQEKYL